MKALFVAVVLTLCPSIDAVAQTTTQDYAPTDMTGRVLTFAGFNPAHFTRRDDGSYEGFDNDGSLRAVFSGAGIAGYAKSGPNSATFAYFRHPKWFSYQLTFTSDTGGTYTADQKAWNPQSGTGVFTLIRLPLLPVPNFSTRVTLAPGGKAIMGIVVKEPGTVSLTLRAAGPALRSFGITNALSNPRLSVYRNDVLVYTNDDWKEHSDYFDAPHNVATLGAFPFEAGSKDAEVLIQGPIPGNYTAVVDNVDGTGGEVLLEGYLYR